MIGRPFDPPGLTRVQLAQVEDPVRRVDDPNGLSVGDFGAAQHGGQRRPCGHAARNHFAVGSQCDVAARRVEGRFVYIRARRGEECKAENGYRPDERHRRSVSHQFRAAASHRRESRGTNGIERIVRAA